jgi:hypothetical protein
MESKSKYTSQLMDDIAVVRSIVEEVFSVDISIRRRKSDYVEARRIFYKILRDEGYSLKQIGLNSPMPVDHTTVIHHLTELESMIGLYSAPRRNYDRCLQMFCETRGRDISMSSVDLRKSVSLLTARALRLEEELDKYKNNADRFKEILNYLSENIPVGKEGRAYRKIRATFNTVGVW